MSTDTDILKEHWLPYANALTRKWPQLTEDDLRSIGGDVDRLKARLQERYDFTPEQVQHEVDAWYREEGQR
ncbi:MAG: hypothetical protein E1N59_239 [Puniceicoccaceae bacterium 5H]|nr:MAG: hypothetical protein E1N59_239 [Puniceicoccaceae bacterium 5H]